MAEFSELFTELLVFADEATTLFRATTLASTLMEQYMKATATPFVHHALKDTILKIMESRQSCEVLVRFLMLTKVAYPPFAANNVSQGFFH